MDHFQCLSFVSSQAAGDSRSHCKQIRFFGFDEPRIRPRETSYNGHEYAISKKSERVIGTVQSGRTRRPTGTRMFQCDQRFEGGIQLFLFHTLRLIFRWGLINLASN